MTTYPPPSSLHATPCTFHPKFWTEVVQRMLACDTPLSKQLLIVPDGSLSFLYHAAWADNARAQQRPALIPRSSTLMAWVKSNGAEDWDSQDTARTLHWMQALPAAPALQAALGHHEHSDLLGLARQMVAMSDELSIHLLAGRDVAWVKKTVTEVIERIYQNHSVHLANDELNLLLSCWQADVDKSTPVVRYLATMQQMTQHIVRPYTQIWVVRNRAWTAHETHFWQTYSEHTTITVLDITQVEVVAGQARARAIQSIAGALSARWINTKNTQTADSTQPVRLYRCANLEEEAQAVVQQVQSWQAAGLRKIALLALDRQVSRRVWALLQRVGIAIRDDTGWLLSTTRAASAWDLGLRLMNDEVAAQDLIDWFSHPALLANIDAQHHAQLKAQYLSTVQHITDRQARSRFARTQHSWREWLNFCQQTATPHHFAHTHLESLFQQAAQYAHAWQQARPLPEWARVWQDWARAFGLWDTLNADDAGQQWCAQLLRYEQLDHTEPMTLAQATRFMASEVEQMMYQPNSHISLDEAASRDTVVLMPLGNTRLRTFDAVWVLGASAQNLPASEQDIGLLNAAVRRELNLPQAHERQALMRVALLDLLALHPQFCASFCAVQDGVPNSLSPWLQQYARASGTKIESINLTQSECTPQIQPRSAARIGAHIPNTVSASDIASVSACPYQYYARKILALSPTKSVEEEIPASTKGNLWHEIIERFFEQRTEPHSTTTDECLLHETIEKTLRPLIEHNPRYWEIHAEFKHHVPAFVAWWQNTEQAGWQHLHSEYTPEPLPTQTINEYTLTWRGRIDQVNTRLDDKGEIVWSVMDYKTNNLKKHQQQIKNDEDTQLAFYINLLRDAAPRVTQAQYIGVNKQSQHDELPVANLGTAEHIATQAAQLYTRVEHWFTAMARNEPLTAMGQLSACTYCDYRALCRKNYAKNEE